MGDDLILDQNDKDKTPEDSASASDEHTLSRFSMDAPDEQASETPAADSQSQDMMATGLELEAPEHQEKPETAAADADVSPQMQVDSQDADMAPQGPEPQSEEKPVYKPGTSEENSANGADISGAENEVAEAASASEEPVPETAPEDSAEVAEKKSSDREDASKKRIGDRLVEQGVINADQLNVALHEKQQSPTKMLGEILVDLGFITPEVLSSVLAESTGYEEFQPSKVVLDPEALALVPKKDAFKYNVLPVVIDEENHKAVVAMADPYDVVALDKLRQLLPRGVTVEPRICPPGVLADAIDNAYGYASSIEGILKELSGNDEIDLENVAEDAAYSHPIVRLVNALVFEGVKIGASDIHFEPEENFIRMRYRIDGVLETLYTMHREYWSGIAQRVKIVSGMNIADKMMPQDGRFELDFGGREADFRVSTLPTVHGENIVLRILDKSSGIMPMEALGFSEHNMKLIKKSQARPEGIIIVTGPTGSGKTTSLYSMLNTVNTPDVNIMTLEDPVEYNLPMIRQTHVREQTGLTFGEGVKSLLRQDPDIIFVGEVRDGVTAEQALKAAMTGHQVYTTLHTNDCFGAIPRLLDLGLKPGMIAGSIIASFAQRLARRLCPNCKEQKTATEEECRLLGVDASNPPEIYHAKGCDECGGTGYKGRIALVEILYMDEDLDTIIAENGHKSALKALAKEKGFKGMIDDGVEKVLEGVTSLEAIMKVVSFSDRL